MTNTLPRFVFATTFILYLFLLLAEFLRPGFVVNAINIHLILIPLMILWLVLIHFSKK